MNAHFFTVRKYATSLREFIGKWNLDALNLSIKSRQNKRLRKTHIKFILMGCFIIKCICRSLIIIVFYKGINHLLSSVITFMPFFRIHFSLDPHMEKRGSKYLRYALSMLPSLFVIGTRYSLIILQKNALKARITTLLSLTLPKN